MNQYEKRKAKSKVTEVHPDEIEPLINPEFPFTLPVKEVRHAYDVFYDPSVKKFIKVCIEYDLTSGTGRVKELVQISDSQPGAIQKMGILFNKKILNIR